MIEEDIKVKKNKRMLGRASYSQILMINSKKIKLSSFIKEKKSYTLKCFTQSFNYNSSCMISLFIFKIINYFRVVQMIICD